MKDQDKTKKQLIDEVTELRRRIAELEVSETAGNGAEQELGKRHRRLEEPVEERATALEEEIDERARTEEAYHALIEHSLQGLLIVQDGCIVFANPGMAALSGYTRQELESFSSDDLQAMVHPEDRERVWKNLQDRLAGKAPPPRYELRFIHKDGEPRWAEALVSRVDYRDKPAVQIACADITERKRAKEALQESEGIAGVLFEARTDLVILVGTDGVILGANEAMAQRFGRHKDELVGVYGWDLVAPDLAESRKAHFDEVIRSGEPRRFEDGRQGAWFDNVFYPVFDAHGKVSKIAVVARDITERKQAEEQIRASLREKEVMLQEIHHRVRNNLAVISSLLDFQMRYTQDGQARAALRESKGRVYSMALVHEQLYRTPDLAQIDFASYVRTLTEHLFGAYQVIPGHVTLELDVGDALLEVGQAIPCGLIITELLTNALKHAFPLSAGGGGEENVICVAFHPVAERAYELAVSDNGVGLPPGFEFPSRETLGIFLINAYARELKGTVAWDGEGGTTCRVVFGREA